MRTPHRVRGIRPFDRTALVAALALALGIGEAHALTINVPADVPTLDQAITQMNALSDCTGNAITIGTGTSAFLVGVSTPLPPVTCPHLTIQGIGSFPYGARISYYGGFSYGAACGIDSRAAPISVLDLEINQFSYGGNSAALCGMFDAASTAHPRAGVHGVQLDGNDNGIIVTGGNGTIGSVGDGNNISSNAWADGGDGIQVQDAASADIGGNTIGSGNFNGITLGGNASSVHDNTISGNNNYGIDVVSSGNLITANYIGVTSDGSQALPNAFAGIEVEANAAGTKIAGNTINAGNWYGIEINGGGSTVTGNTIGADATGKVGLGGYEGLITWAGNNDIDGNLISGNDYGAVMYGGGSFTRNKVGVDISGTNGMGGSEGFYAEATDNSLLISGNTIADQNTGLELYNVTGGIVQGNNIGVSSTGGPLATSLGSPTIGIMVTNSTGVTIGDASDSSLGNTVGGQGCAGVQLQTVGSSTIGYNSIGVAANGTTPLGNSGYGVLASTSSGCFSYGGPLSMLLTAKVGAPSPTGNHFVGNNISFNGSTGILFDVGAGSNGNSIELNTITHNGDSGVAIRDSAGIHNVIVSNAIFNNPPKNIELYRDPTTPSLPLPNDAGDVDTGPNEGMNYPEIQSVTDDGTKTLVTYRLNGPTDTTHAFTVQFYSAAAGEPGGIYLDQESPAPVNGLSGDIVSKPLPTGIKFISLTATMDGIETSEFSPVATAVPVPVLTVTPPSQDFGSVEFGDTSQPFTNFSLASTGTAPWTLNGLTTNGSCAFASPPTLACGANFVCSTTCVAGSSYGPGGGCTISAQFSPSSLGASSVSISVCDNTGAITTIDLTGSGTLPPPVTVTPNGFDFGTVLIGTSSATQAFTLANPAKTSVTLSAPSATAPFSIVSSTCTTTLAPSGTCTITARFTPATGGVASGQVGANFTSTATGAPVTLPAVAVVAGIGASVIQLSLPTSLDVGTFTLGLAAPVATATLTNTGAAPAPITSIVATSPFTLSHNCPASLAAGASCTLTLTLSGSTAGPVTGSVTLTTPAGVQRMALAGAIAAPGISMSTGAIDFGTVQVGHVSAVQEIGVINTTAVDMPIGAPALSGPFRIDSTNCASPLPAHTSCSVQVQFAPAQAGAANGALSVAYGVTGATAAAPIKRSRARAKAGSQIVATTLLTGVGADIASLDMTQLVEFGAYVLGSPAIVRTVTLTSTGNIAVSFADISVSGPFALSHDCPSTLAPGASCTLTISFSSTTLGSAAGLVSIRSNAVGGLRTISLGALVQARPVPVIDISPVSISFGSRIFGSQSTDVTVTVTNSGAAGATLGPFSASTNYIIGSNTCGATLAPGATCTATVALRPLAFGPVPSALSFTSNAAGSPHQVSLDGTGCRPPTLVGNRTNSGADSCKP